MLDLNKIVFAMILDFSVFSTLHIEQQVETCFRGITFDPLDQTNNWKNCYFGEFNYDIHTTVPRCVIAVGQTPNFDFDFDLARVECIKTCFQFNTRPMKFYARLVLLLSVINNTKVTTTKITTKTLFSPFL